MRSTIETEKRKASSGYTLIELAIVMIVIGVLFVPAIAIYSLYMKEQRFRETSSALSNAYGAVGTFRSLYGRYPCPADPTIAPGQPGYGLEDCTLTPVVGNNAALANPNVLIGALPYRQMNMAEADSIDGYGNRLTYAVTQALTDPGTFSVTLGGISVVDPDGNSAVQPPDTAHFVVLTHNERADGALTRFGTVVGVCPAPPSPENENCNGDATFVSSPLRADFDDMVAYMSDRSIDPWRYSTADQNDIRLRDLTGMALGVPVGVPPPVSATVDVEEKFMGDDGAQLFVEKSDLPDTGRVMSDRICDENATNCFDPGLVGKTFDAMTDTPGVGNLMCPPGEFLVGIAGSAPICDTKVWFSCPAGKFVRGFNPTGGIVCDFEPPPGCAAESVAATCGDTRTIDATYSGGYSYAYSGECYMVPTLNPSVFNSMTLAEIQAEVAARNLDPRIPQDCGPDKATGLVRDTFACLNGDWKPAGTSTSPVNTLERGSQTSGGHVSPTNFPSYGPTYTGGYAPAETSGPAYSLGADPTYDNGYHDCWCEEGYRVTTPACDAGFVGTKVVVEKHECPQTGAHWTKIWESSGLCTCNPGTYTTETSCESHFGVASGSITGTVYFTNQRTCVGGVPSVSIIATNTNDCKCPTKTPNPDIKTTPCPTGWTNGVPVPFIYDGNSYSNTQKIEYKHWVCGVAELPPPQQPATSAADAGHWTGWVDQGPMPACFCDSTRDPEQWTEACPSPTQSGSITYQKNWNCTLNGGLGDWDPPFVIPGGNNCSNCYWKKPSGDSPTLQDVAFDHPVGSTGCSCGDTAFCYESTANPDQYNVWSGCSCSPP